MENGIMNGVAYIPRGIRNCNPFNIKKSSSNWLGKIDGKDKVFETFESMEYGYRAGLVLLINYVHQGCNTIDKIISRFAPSSENNTVSYKRFVCDYTGLSLDDVIDSFDKVILLAIAIIKYENGLFPYDYSVSPTIQLLRVYSKFNLKL